MADQDIRLGEMKPGTYYELDFCIEGKHRHRRRAVVIFDGSFIRDRYTFVMVRGFSQTLRGSDILRIRATNATRVTVPRIAEREAA